MNVLLNIDFFFITGVWGTLSINKMVHGELISNKIHYPKKNKTPTSNYVYTQLFLDN